MNASCKFVSLLATFFVNQHDQGTKNAEPCEASKIVCSAVISIHWRRARGSVLWLLWKSMEGCAVMCVPSFFGNCGHWNDGGWWSCTNEIATKQETCYSGGPAIVLLPLEYCPPLRTYGIIWPCQWHLHTHVICYVQHQQVPVMQAHLLYFYHSHFKMSGYCAIAKRAKSITGTCVFFRGVLAWWLAMELELMSATPSGAHEGWDASAALRCFNARMKSLFMKQLT